MHCTSEFFYGKDEEVNRHMMALFVKKDSIAAAITSHKVMVREELDGRPRGIKRQRK